MPRKPRESGLVNSVAEDQGLTSTVEQLIARIVSVNPIALTHVKSCFARSHDVDIDTAVMFENETATKCFVSTDLQEDCACFLRSESGAGRIASYPTLRDTGLVEVRKHYLCRNPDWRELLAVVEVNLDIENEDAAEEATHVELRAVTEMMHNEKMVPPVYAASLTSNGVACLYVF